MVTLQMVVLTLYALSLLTTLTSLLFLRRLFSIGINRGINLVDSGYIGVVELAIPLLLLVSQNHSFLFFEIQYPRLLYRLSQHPFTIHQLTNLH